MGSYLRCSWCGRTYKHKGGSVARFLGGDLLGDAVTGIAGFAGDNYCSEACRQAAQGSGGSDGSSAKAEAARIKAQARAEEEAEERAEAKRKEAAHKQAIQNIKDYVFDDSSDENFDKSVITFMAGYSECHPGIFADGDYKKAYKSRVEKELKLLNLSKPDYAEKLNSHYQEALETLKKKTKTRLIISAVIIGIAMIILPIFIIVCGSSSIGSSIGSGLFGGLVFGGIFATIPQTSIGKTKTADE